LIRADLHIHTTYSDDSTVTTKTLIEKLAAHKSVKAAAVTDHDTLSGLEETRRLAAPYPDILVIPGIEISTAEGDILVLGAEETPPKPWTAQNIVDFARTKNYVSVIAHPYREYGMGELARNHKFDAVEVINGESTPQANKMAHELAKTMKLPGVAGSDAHSPPEPLTVYTEIQAGLDVDEILEAIKKGLVTTHSTARSIHF